MYSGQFVCLILFAVVSASEVQHSAPYKSLLALTQASLDGCFEDMAYTKKIEIEDGFDALLKGKRNPPRNTKCLRFCIMRSNNLFDEENQLSLYEMLEFFKNLLGNTLKEEDLNDVVVYCKELASAENDSCERAYAATMCILEELKERGYGQF